MESLSYDPSTDPEYLSEIEASEQEALQIGEQLEADQQKVLAGKFTNAEELEKAYLELQSRFSKGDRTESNEDEELEDVEAEETEEEEFDIIARLQEEGENYSEETLNYLDQLNSEQVAELLVQATAPKQEYVLSPADELEFKNYAGGEQVYSQMTSWAAENWTPEQVAAFNAVTDSQNPQAIFFAIQALQLQYRDAVGQEGALVTSRRTSPSQDVFRSQAELSRAMSDPRYDDDPAYRQDVYDKLERSNF